MCQKNLIDTLNESIVPPRKIMLVLSKESGGDYNVGCIAKDVENYLCLWQILQKVQEDFAHVYNKYPSFQVNFHHCIHDTLTIEEFELEWSLLVSKYELRENDLLNKLYMRRQKWVSAYLRNTFCAGMSTTQRSESMNKFFKDYVHSSTMVRDFVHQYDKELNACYLKEKEKDVKTKTSRPILKTCYKMEAEVAKVYTRKSFLMIQ